jgi:hypothetical protein
MSVGRLARDDEAQATTEYVLILAVVVGIAILVARELVGPALKALTDGISRLIEEKMFKPDSMHRSPFRPPGK